VALVNLRETVMPDSETPGIELLVQLTGGSVQGSFILTNRIDRARLTASGLAERSKVLALNLNALHVGQSMYVYGLYSGLWAQNLAVSDDVVLQTELLFQLVLIDAKIGGSLDLSHFHFANRGCNLISENPLSFPFLNLSNVEIQGSLKLGEPSSEDGKITLQRARLSRPSCYPSLCVVEVGAFRDKAALEKEQAEWGAFLAGKGGSASALDGNSLIFHRANDARLRRTATDGEKADYLRLFCAYVWGDDGSFRIVGDPHDVRQAPIEGDLPQIAPLTLDKPKSNTQKSVVAETSCVIAYLLQPARYRLCEPV
jgi:hypothetical protein